MHLNIPIMLNIKTNKISTIINPSKLWRTNTHIKSRANNLDIHKNHKHMAPTCRFIQRSPIKSTVGSMDIIIMCHKIRLLKTKGLSSNKTIKIHLMPKYLSMEKQKTVFRSLPNLPKITITKEPALRFMSKNQM